MTWTGHFESPAWRVCRLALQHLVRIVLIHNPIRCALLPCKPIFYLAIAVQDITDHQASGEVIARVVEVLEPFSPGRVPGPNPGYIGIRFFTSASEENLWFQRTAAKDLLNSGKTGAALYDALR